MNDESEDSDQELKALYDVNVKLSTVLGISTMQVSDLLRLQNGDIVELDRQTHHPVDIYVNNQLIGQGNLIEENGRLGVNVTKMLKLYSSSSYSQR